MGKLKKIIALVLVFCTVFLCTACTKNVTFREYNKSNKYEDPYPLLKKIVELSDFTGMTLKDHHGELIVFFNTDCYKVYNIDTNSIVAEFPANEVSGVKFFGVAEQTFFAVRYAGSNGEQALPATEAPAAPPAAAETPAAEAPAAETPATEETAPKIESAPKTEIYNTRGDLVVTTDDPLFTLSSHMDMFEIGNSIYRVNEKGKVHAINSNPFFGGIPEVNYQAGSYYYCIDDDWFAVYDEALTSVFFWEVPHSDAECFISPLGSNILVQMHIPLPITETEYDYLADNEKYALESLIINPKSGKITSVELDYILLYSDAAFTGEPDDENHATVVMIEDKRVQAADSSKKYVTLNEKNGKITSFLCTDIYGRTEMIAKDRYLYYTYSGDTYLIDSKGKTLAKVNELGRLTDANVSFFMHDDVIYNYDLKQIVNLEEKALDVGYFMGHSILLANENFGAVLLKQDGSMQELDYNPDEMYCRAYKQVYILGTEESLTVYDENGTPIGDSIQAAKVNFVDTYGDTLLLSTLQDGSLHYYKISS